MGRKGEKTSVNCAACGKEKEVSVNRLKYNKTGKFYCSFQCKGGKVKTICTFCQKEYEVVLSQFLPFKNHFCSNNCKMFWQKENKQEVVVNCFTCGKEITMSLIQSESYTKHYCNASCRKITPKKDSTVETECINCHTIFKIKPCRLEKTKNVCCSKKCKGEFSRRSIIMECSFCGKSIMKRPSEIIPDKKYFCSSRCNILSKDKSNKAVCSYCGKNFKASLSRITKLKNIFCSCKCRGAFGISDETRQKMSNSAKGKPKSDLHKQHLSEANKGSEGYWFGKKRSEEDIEKMRVGHTGIVVSEETRKKRSESMKGRVFTEEWRRKLSITRTKQWQDPEYADKVRAAVKIALNVTPNKPESFILSILNEFYPGEWKFVGDGCLNILGKNPDFANYQTKQLIEHFGDYWHKDADPEQRKEIFAREGWDTLVIWEYELKNLDEVIYKIQKFINFS